MKVNPLDPYGIDRDAPLEKFKHHFEEKQRVRIKKDGRVGRIRTINNLGHLNIDLDSGHFVQCVDSECDPEDFPPAPRTMSAMSATEKSFAKSYSPYGFLFEDEPEQLDGIDRAVLTKAAGGGLVRALERRNVSASDLAIIKIATRNIQNHHVVTSPFGIGEDEEENHRNLRIMAEKYAGTSGGEVTIAKRTDLQKEEDKWPTWEQTKHFCEWLASS